MLEQFQELSEVRQEVQKQNGIKVAKEIQKAAGEYREVIEWGLENRAEVARKLRDLVAALPELKETIEQQSSVSTSTPNLLMGTASEQEILEANQLLDEAKATRFDEMSDQLLQAVISEFVARARLLQERTSLKGYFDIPIKLIRMLTAVAGKRKVRVYGLSRHQQSGDWELIREESKKDRLSIEGAGKGGLTARITIPDAVRAKVEATKRERKKERDEAREEREQEISLPKLSAAVEAGKKLIIFGGMMTKPEKLEELQRRTGISAEWLGADDGIRRTQALERSVLEGNVAAVIVLDGLISHRSSGLVTSACKQIATPIKYADRGGIASLLKAMMDIEEELKSPADGHQSKRG